MSDDARETLEALRRFAADLRRVFGANHSANVVDEAVRAWEKERDTFHAWLLRETGCVTRGDATVVLRKWREVAMPVWAGAPYIAPPVRQDDCGCPIVQLEEDRFKTLHKLGCGRAT